MQVIMRKIDELIPAEYNPRQLTEKQFADLVTSFQNLGTLEPAVINTNAERKNIIISGHQRLRVAKHLGKTEYPCVEVDLDRAKEMEANIRLNKNTGAWDYDLLANNFDLEELKDWGFEDWELKIGVPALDGDREQDTNILQSDLEVYEAGMIKQVVLYFTAAQYEPFIAKLRRLQEARQTENFTDLVTGLVQEAYDATNQT